MIVEVSVALNRTIVDNLCGSHLQNYSGLPIYHVG